MTTSNDLFYQLCDLTRIPMQVDLCKTKGSITGSTAIGLEFMEGCNLHATPEVVDSYIRKDSLAAVLVRVIGHLYMAMIASSESRTKLLCIMIDGQKLGWTIKRKPSLFLDPWDRTDIFKVIVRGTVAVYSYDRKTDAWSPVGEGAEYLQSYIDRKSDPRLGEDPQARKATHDKYRTTGPRGV